VISDSCFIPRFVLIKVQISSIAWLSLDNGDNDPASFWSYVLACLQTQREGVGKQAANLLQTTPSPDLEVILMLLVNELSKIPDPFLLVLDDYHLKGSLS